MLYWSEDRKFVEKEFKRMGFQKDGRWRICDINKDFELCNTYPRFLILPSNFKDEDLELVAKYRYFRRIPTAVWRHIKNGCFIVRSSQPSVGWFGWFRCEQDEQLVHSYVNNTLLSIKDKNQHQPDVLKNKQTTTGDQLPDNSNSSTDHQQQSQQVLTKNESTPRPNNVNTCETNNSPHCRLNVDTNSLHSQNDDIHNNNNNNATTSTNAPTQNGTGTTNGTTNPANQTGADDDGDIKLNDLTKPSQLLTTTLVASPAIGVTTATEATGPTTTTNHSTSSLSTTTSNTYGNTTPAQVQASTTDNQLAQSIDPSSEAPEQADSKMVIIDARGYAAAMANRAKGGGCECSEYYRGCEVQFMNLANIHSIRKSFQAIRSVCEAYSEQSNNWVSFLDNSRWLHHISGLLKSALLIVDSIDVEEKSILIHCSDGWDRTPQLVALAEIMLDPYYRTFEGFKILIQREWLDFGHKFADRCGSDPCNEDPNERCPVFLQWLDCVQQLIVQYPTHFEFNLLYLDKLNRHTYSNVFGTFSHNSTQERILARVDEKAFSLWSYFDSSRRKFTNENHIQTNEILRPSYKVKELHFWKEVYLPSHRNQTPSQPVLDIVGVDSPQQSIFIDDPTGNVYK